MAELETCYRCGIDFDPSDFVFDAPCADCQLDFPDNFLRVDVQARLEETRIDQLITRLHDMRMSSPQIGEAIGMTAAQVRRRRTKLGLEGHTFSGTELWRDYEKNVKELSERMTADPIILKRWAKEGAKPTYAGIKAQRSL